MVALNAGTFGELHTLEMVAGSVNALANFIKKASWLICAGTWLLIRHFGGKFHNMEENLCNLVQRASASLGLSLPILWLRLPSLCFPVLSKSCCLCYVFLLNLFRESPPAIPICSWQLEIAPNKPICSLVYCYQFVACCIVNKWSKMKASWDCGAWDHWDGL